MNRADLTAEIARIEAAAPSTIAAFNTARATRLAALKVDLAALPAEPEPMTADEIRAEAQLKRLHRESLRS